MVLSARTRSVPSDNTREEYSIPAWRIVRFSVPRRSSSSTLSDSMLGTIDRNARETAWKCFGWSARSL